MGKIKKIVVHCTGEPANAKRNKEYYRKFFFEVQGWKHFGYHAIVYQDGTWERLQPWPKPTAEGGNITNETLANGAQGHNWDSLHVAYVGGIDPITKKPTDTRTQEQKKTLRAIIAVWKIDYKIDVVVGHRDLPGVKKVCPCFDAIKTYKNV